MKKGVVKGGGCTYIWIRGEVARKQFDSLFRVVIQLDAQDARGDSGDSRSLLQRHWWGLKTLTTVRQGKKTFD